MTDRNFIALILCIFLCPAAFAQTPDTENVPATSAPITEQTPPASPSDQAAPEAQPDNSWDGSLMFPQKRLDDLVSIYEAYVANHAKLQKGNAGDAQNADVNVSDIIRQTQGEQKEIPEEIAKITLGSIVYHDPAQWSIWINGKRYQSKDASEGFVVTGSTFRVLSTTPYETVLMWMPLPESIGKTTDRWKAKQQRTEPLSPLLANNERILFNSENAQTTFTLKPNQTFDSLSMSVWEGRPKVTIPPEPKTVDPTPLP